MERKTDPNGKQTTLEPEVVKAVQDEVKKLGDNTKANFEELQKSYTELKHIVDTAMKDDKKFEDLDAQTKEKLTKFGEEISTRQEELDKKVDEAQAASKVIETTLNSRMDEIDIAMQRVPKGMILPDQKEAAEMALAFQIAALSAKNKDGVKQEMIDALEPDVDAYAEYVKTLNCFFRKDEKLLTPEQLKLLYVGSDPDGGYTVTPAMSAKIITRLFELDPIRGLAATETITTGALEWMVDWDEAGWGWEAETESGDETDTPKWYKKRIPVHVMYAKPRASQTLLEDSGINVENWLATKVADRFLRGEGAAFVDGDGVGKPRGFLSYANGTNYGQIERINYGLAANLTADGFIDHKYHLIEQFLSRGTWLMNRTTVRDAMYLKDGEGRYIWKPAFSDDRISTILGLPVRMSTTMPAVAANALAVALADWGEAYQIVDRLGITIQRDPYTAKPLVEFYTRKRVGGDVANFQAIKIGVIAI